MAKTFRSFTQTVYTGGSGRDSGAQGLKCCSAAMRSRCICLETLFIRFRGRSRFQGSPGPKPWLAGEAFAQAQPQQLGTTADLYQSSKTPKRLLEVYHPTGLRTICSSMGCPLPCA
jgi:hypothetical protein